MERIDEIEKVTNHDVIAFTTNMAEYIDADVPEGTEPPSRWVHYGMTSSDLGDTALSYQITQAIDIILEDIKQLGETCKRRAFEFQETLCVGRTHGIHAIAMQVRLLQQSDVIEAEEPFAKGQKGSSAMPHKRNPITAERVCGLARTVKSNAQVAFDNVALWYERDISHSGAERVALADSFIALDYMFGKMQWMLDGLQTYPAKMEHNLWRTKGLIFSSKVLLALVDTGISREEAYVIVQRNAMKVWEDIQNAVDGPTYRENLEADPEANLSAEVLDEIFDPWDFLTRKDVVFDRLKELEL